VELLLGVYLVTDFLFWMFLFARLVLELNFSDFVLFITSLVFLFHSFLMVSLELLWLLCEFSSLLIEFADNALCLTIKFIRLPIAKKSFLNLPNKFLILIISSLVILGSKIPKIMLKVSSKSWIYSWFNFSSSFAKILLTLTKLPSDHNLFSKCLSSIFLVDDLLNEPYFFLF